jgi:tRNA G26 N,N-dimethylase Trm1
MEEKQGGNGMSDTPRTFKMIAYAPTGLKINPAFNQAVDLCEQLEIELNAANERIKRLEEAGDKIVESGWSVQDWSGMCVVWAKAKEDKL